MAKGKAAVGGVESEAVGGNDWAKAFGPAQPADLTLNYKVACREGSGESVSGQLLTELEQRNAEFEFRRDTVSGVAN